MKSLTLETMIAVFEEIFGRGLFWAMVAAAVLVTMAYVYVLVRDRALSMRKFLWAQLAMPAGAVAAVLFVLGVTSSHLRDIGGPVDVIVLLGVAMLGAMGAAILVYTAQSLFRGKPAHDRPEPILP
jgi:drug/metabolite transporter (DMT)-like permease